MSDPPPRFTRAPTVADVARRAGVSTATVSRCLNAPGRVQPETRARVLAAVDALGYAPNSSAQALAARRSNTMGAVIPTMENAIFARGVQALQEELVRHGKTLLIASSSYRPDLEEAQIRTLVQRGADGLMLIGLSRDAAVHDFLHQRGVPTLAAWCYAPDSPLPCVGFDNRAAMAAMAQAVIETGHRRLGMISAPVAANDRARDRVAGVRQAMAAAGLRPETLRLVETEYGIATGADALHRILDAAPDVTAVICGNDVLAVGALQGAAARGLAVPADLSITGFDDIEIAALARPALTTVHVPHREMGRRAARLLVDAVYGDGALGSVELDTALRLRDSLAPPPQR